MKIAIIANSHYPVKKPFSGGLNAHTYQLTQLLMNKGHEITLFAPQYSDPSLPVETFCPPAIQQGKKPTLHRALKWEPYYKKLIKRIAHGNFDVIHNNSYARTPLDMVFDLNIPMITTLHCPPHLPMISGYRNAVHCPNHFTLAVSQIIANHWKKEINQLNPQVVYNSVDTDFWHPIDVKEKVEKYAVWSGRITKEKGVHLAIEASVKANIPLKLCGPIHDNEYFDSEVLPLLVKHKSLIEYCGCKTPKDLKLILQRASVLVCTPCWEEAFGLVIAEALSCGVPIAGFKRGALPEILSENNSVLVSENTDELARAILNAQHLSRSECRRYAVDHFSESRMIDEYLQTYRKAIDETAVVQR